MRDIGGTGYPQLPAFLETVQVLSMGRGIRKYMDYKYSMTARLSRSDIYRITTRVISVMARNGKKNKS
jgi:hypothetical protein